MCRTLARSPRYWLVLALVLCACGRSAPTEPVPVRYQQGTLHGFLELRSADDRLLASGDFIQVAHGDEVTAHTVFHFQDGSLDDETTVFSQHHVFQLVSDHHVQKGPFFPHPLDARIEPAKQQITIRSAGKDGKETVKTQHFDLPQDLANGMLPLLMENLPPGAAQTTVPMLVFTPDPRLVDLVITPLGPAPFSIGGASRTASKFQIKFDIGGVTGVLAHLFGKQPPNLYFWIDEGPAPTFLRERGQIFANGPIVSINLVGPGWPQ